MLGLQASGQDEVDYEWELDYDIHDDEDEAQDLVRVKKRVKFALNQALIHVFVALVYHHD